MHRLRNIGIVSILGGLLPSVCLASSEGNGTPVSLWASIPFALLLLSIAIAPFINRHWWERWYPAVSVGLGACTIAYYLFGRQNSESVLHTLTEYVSFIALIGSLFVVAGGILIRIKGKSTPWNNVYLLAIGAVLSNLVGTTGASMILIRPWLRVNKYRIRPFHVVFFIFVVSNMGGALTPIGDPPLFLGYLRGIPFFWTVEQLWLPWLVAMALILGVFYVLDVRSFHALPVDEQHKIEKEDEVGEAKGLQNILFLMVILIAVFVTDPPFLREALMVLAAAGSYYMTKPEIHRQNEFNFLPIKEVALLFLGIFSTMIPALEWLDNNATSLGIVTPGQFYWATGTLSSFLDNAPTYLNFLTASIGLLVPDTLVSHVGELVKVHGIDVLWASGVQGPEVRSTLETLLRYHYDQVAAHSVPSAAIQTAAMLGSHALHIQGISLGAVFFGACTYIGNGPNFMVKSIADQAGVHCPSFFGYVVRFAIPFLLPVFTLIWLLFFRS